MDLQVSQSVGHLEGEVPPIGSPFTNLDELIVHQPVPKLAFAFIDSEIDRLLRTALDSNVSGGLNSLFGPMAPLGSASARINMAHALSWVSGTLAHDLHVLRRIRNLFAHDRMELGLDDARAKDMLSNHEALVPTLSAFMGVAGIDVASGIPATIDPDPPLYFNTRNRLILASGITARRCMAELYVAPQALRSAVSPAALLHPESSTVPSGIVGERDTFKEFLDALLWVATSPDRVVELPSVGHILWPASSTEDDQHHP
jgi:hypothetical protein